MYTVQDHPDIIPRGDSSEHLNLVRKLERQRRDLESLNNELNHFTYVAAHALKEPLRTLSSYIRKFVNTNRRLLDDESLNNAGCILEINEQMTTLIAGLLEYSRVTRPSCGWHNVQDIVNEVLFMMDRRIKRGNVKILCHSLNEEVLCDKVQLLQVFQNLISNGIKFRKKGQGTIIEIAKETSEDERYNYFYARDNGRGIGQEDFDKIFQMFSRGSNIVTDGMSANGSGIGLAVCRKVVERHGGRIWVESKENKGSTFHFTLLKNPVNGKNGA